MDTLITRGENCEALAISARIYQLSLVELRLICLAAQQSGNGQDAGTSAEAISSTEAANPPIQSRAITTVTQATPTPGPSVPVSLDLFQVIVNFFIFFFCSDNIPLFTDYSGLISQMTGVGARGKGLPILSLCNFVI